MLRCNKGFPVEAEELQAAEHQIFQGHAANLPRVTLFAVNHEHALSSVVEARRYVEHAVASLVLNQDGMVGKTEFKDHRAAQLRGVEVNG